MSHTTVSHTPDRPWRARVLEHLKKTEGLTGADDDLVPRHQVFLLGGNPLPVLVSILALEPEVAHILTSKEVRDDTLSALAGAVDSLPCRQGRAPIWLKTYERVDAFSRTSVRSRLEAVASQVGTEPLGLNYTGGTKVMAAQALAWWEAREPGGDHVHRCSYLRGDIDALTFDGVSQPFPVHDIDVPLEHLLSLHGQRIKVEKTLAHRMRPLDQIDWNEPQDPVNTKKSVKGSIFEERWYTRLKSLGFFKPECLHLDIHVEAMSHGTASKDFQLDIVGVRGHIPVLFTLTLKSHQAEVKTKAMEALLRVQQLGGELGRVVVASWLETDDLEELCHDLRSHWEGPELFRVLGRAHYQGLADVSHVPNQRAPVSETVEQMLSSWFKR